LVVDDEAQARLMILATLEREGYGVHQATSGRKAMDMLEQNTFDLVLTDIAMTDGSGMVLLERLREEQPHVPVVMATAIHDIGVAIDAMRRGAYDYLLKPFDREHLISTV
jgi:DNA-binding NtrC family response regulator